MFCILGRILKYIGMCIYRSSLNLTHSNITWYSSTLLHIIPKIQIQSCRPIWQMKMHIYRSVTIYCRARILCPCKKVNGDFTCDTYNLHCTVYSYWCSWTKLIFSAGYIELVEMVICMASMHRALFIVLIIREAPALVAFMKTCSCWWKPAVGNL